MDVYTLEPIIRLISLEEAVLGVTTVHFLFNNKDGIFEGVEKLSWESNGGPEVSYRIYF